MKPLHFTIMVDDRERKALPFRASYTVLDRSRPPPDCASRTALIRIQPCRLEGADYALADEAGIMYTAPDARGCAVVETKRSADEIATNCLTPVGRRRMVSLLQRLRSRYHRPLLLLEGSPSRFLSPTRETPNPGLALDALLDLSNEYSVPLQTFGGDTISQRWLAGEFVARFLISGALSHGHCTNLGPTLPSL